MKKCIFLFLLLLLAFSVFVSYRTKLISVQTFFLISPFKAVNNNHSSGDVKLVDFKGKVYRHWKTTYQPLYSLLDGNGNIYVAEIIPADLIKAPGGGMTGRIEKINSKGEILWSYENPFMHHDFDILPNGNILISVFSKLSPDFAEKIQGGFISKMSKIPWSDTILEIDQNKKIVWSWSFQDHVRPEDFVLNDYVSKNEFSHTNSVKFYESNPINGSPCVLISARHLGTIFLIDKASGSVLWKSPKGMLSFQHDASLNLKDGTVMAFDNGLFREQERPFLYSRVVKINPLTNKIVWSFDGGESGPEKAAFASSIMGGAQDLENGNILITLAVLGKVIEISQNSKFISEYENTYLGSPLDGGIPNNVLFKVKGYNYKKLMQNNLLNFWSIF